MLKLWYTQKEIDVMFGFLTLVAILYMEKLKPVTSGLRA